MSSLENCPICGNPCSENAPSCPQCGEPLTDGWAERERAKRIEAQRLTEIADEEERQRKQEIIRKLKRKKWRNRVILWAVIAITIGGLYGKSRFDDYQKANLETTDPAEFKRQIDKLESIVSKVPASNFNENIRLYKELLSLKPDSDRYSNKIEFYEKKKLISEQKAIEKKKAEKAQEEIEKKRKGFHCLSSWNGSHRSIVKYVEKGLRDPDSFEHIETNIWPVTPKGEHQLMMRYRAKNGFGGMTIGKVVATVKNSDCSATITLSE